MNVSSFFVKKTDTRIGRSCPSSQLSTLSNAYVRQPSQMLLDVLLPLDMHTKCKVHLTSIRPATLRTAKPQPLDEPLLCLESESTLLLRQLMKSRTQSPSKKARRPRRSSRYKRSSTRSRL